MLKKISIGHVRILLPFTALFACLTVLAAAFQTPANARSRDAAQTCPSGGPPMCVVCGAPDKCVDACYGDFTCTMQDRVCGYIPTNCRTYGSGPTRGFYL